MGRQHHGRQLILAGAQLAQQIDAILVGQAAVQDQSTIIMQAQIGAGVSHCTQGIDLITGATQLRGNQPGKIVVIFDQKQAHGRPSPVFYQGQLAWSNQASGSTQGFLGSREPFPPPGLLRSPGATPRAAPQLPHATECLQLSLDPGAIGEFAAALQYTQ